MVAAVGNCATEQDAKAQAEVRKDVLNITFDPLPVTRHWRVIDDPVRVR